MDTPPIAPLFQSPPKPAPPPVTARPPEAEGPAPKKRLPKFALLVLPVVIAVVAAVIASRTFFLPRPAAVTTPPIEPAATGTPSTGQLAAPQIERPEADDDNDGLVNREEIQTYHTNPANADSDSDGLADGDEVNVFKTDPLNEASAGSPYLDGTNLKNGYDPLHPGVKLSDDQILRFRALGSIYRLHQPSPTTLKGSPILR